MAGATALYTPQILALATALAAFPHSDALPMQGRARSQACGSTLGVGLKLDAAAKIATIGLRVHACAIGQAAAAIFAHEAIGTDRARIAATLSELEEWLVGTGELPNWPGLAALAAARSYPGRHGAILLPWKAALDALSSGGERG